MLIKTDAFGASWLLPIGFKFPKPNFRLSQEFSGTKSTIEKNVALSMSFVGTLPFVWGHCKGMKSYRTTVTCALIAYSPLFSWHTSSARGEGRTKAVNKVGQNCELCGGFLLAGELLSSLSDLLSLGWEWIGLSVCSICGLGEAWGYVMNCAQHIFLLARLSVCLIVYEQWKSLKLFY